MSIVLPSFANGFYLPSSGKGTKYANLWNGCVGAWHPGLGYTGANILDYSLGVRPGLKTPGTMVNAADAWEGSEKGLCIHLDGNQYYDLGTPLLNQLTAPQSFSIWISLDTTASAHTTYSGQTNGFLLRINAGKIELLKSNVASVLTGTTTIQANRWYHVYGHVRPNGADYTWSCYMDGRLDGETTSATVPSTVTTIRLFDDTNLYRLDGKWTDARIYNRALSPSEIALLARYPGIAYEADRRRRRVFAVGAAPAATPWYYARRSAYIIGGGF